VLGGERRGGGGHFPEKLIWNISSKSKHTSNKQQAKMTATMMIGEMPEVLSKLIQDYARPNKVRWEVITKKECDEDDPEIKYFVDETKAGAYYEKCADDVFDAKIFKSQIYKQKYDDGWEYSPDSQDHELMRSDCECCANPIVVGEYDEYAWCENCPHHFCLECVRWKDDECVFYCKNCYEEMEEEEESDEEED